MLLLLEIKAVTAENLYYELEAQLVLGITELYVYVPTI